MIDPKFIPPEMIQKHSNIQVKTIIGQHYVSESVQLPPFAEFNSNKGSMTFFVCKFHNYFDGLIGWDIIKTLKAVIDVPNRLMKLPAAEIKIFEKPNLSSGKYTILPHSQIMAQVPVDKKSGNVVLKNTFIGEKFKIPGGIYTADKWKIILPVQNLVDTAEIFFTDQPLKVDYLEKDYDVIDFNVNNEIHNFESHSAEKVNFEKNLRIDHLNTEEREALINVCSKFKSIFSMNNKQPALDGKVTHKIATKDEIPIYTKSYRYPYIHKEEVRFQISKMLEDKIIRPSFSPWSSPVWIVPKKMDASGKKKWRLVIDYRKLNEKTIDDKYPIPNISDILDKLGKSMYFSTLDLASGFHQIAVHPQDIPKTAFSVENGHYEFIRMPFGLKNAPATFQRLMDNVLKELQGTICLVYMDDIIVYSTSLQEHIENLKKVFLKLEAAQLKVQLDKCEFLQKETAFLGHIVSVDGIKPNPDKIKSIQNFPIPNSQKEIKQFLGLVGYYRKFIKDFAKITKPLTKCLKKGEVIKHTPEFIKSVNICKHLLMNDPILTYPDFSKEFILTTDASNIAIGAVLSQGNVGHDKPICYASRTLTDTEQKYSTIEKELLAIVWATKYFRPYLFGRKFKIYTDHRPLTWLFSIKEPNSKLIRWRLKLEEFDYEIIYKPGKINSNADALSRVKIEEINLNENEIESESDEQDEPQDSDDMDTIHSAHEDNTDNIPISENLLNDFANQIVILKNNETPHTKFEILFRSKKRHTFQYPGYNDRMIIWILKKAMPPKKSCGIYCPDLQLFQRIQNIYSHYFSRNKLFKLVKCTKNVQNITEETEQDKIVENQHNSNGHRGINEVFSHIRREAYFPKMKAKITKFINSCKVCKENKYDRSPPKPNFEITQSPSRPLEICHGDLFYVNRENFFLTIIDKFSKFAQAYKLESRNSIHIKQALFKFISSYGKPKQLVLDQESGFNSIEFKNFCSSSNINLHITSVKGHSSNAPVERFHSTLLELLRITNDTPEYKEYSIENKVHQCIFFYNNSIHSKTKYTPFELFFGRKYDDNLAPNLEFLMKYQNHFYDQIIPDINRRKENLIRKLNEKRSDPIDYENNQPIFVTKDRRTKLTPKFREIQINDQQKITVTDTTNRKFHKSTLRKPNKTQ